MLPSPSSINHIKAKVEDAKRILEDIEDYIAKHSGSPLAKLNPAQLDALPWKPYREGHRAAWIFSETKGAETLVEAIKHSKAGKIELGGFSYKLSGPKENPTMFISRTPVKTE